MTDMPRIVVFWFLTITLVSCASIAGFAQAQPPQNAAPQAPAAAKPGQPGSQQELDAYNRLHNEVDPTIKRSLIDRFATDYPQSGLLAYVYQDGVYLGRQANNIEMMSDYGNKSLDLWPENYTLLTELGSVYVQRDRVDEAGSKATRALDLLGDALKPAGISEQQWTENKKMLLATNFLTLGFAHLRHAQAATEVELQTAETEDAIESFRKALENRPVDDFAFYGLGFAFAIQNDYPNAESNLAKAVAVNGIVLASARSLLEDIYKSQHRQSLNGLDQVIARARAELGLDRL